ncbi:MAG TPA: phosphoenolpyruvate--protein phosphotransferase [Pirellulaceae bacterium]|nr:phosphoenolpyruvate--protein phosphotransferase [Pirellulaceae bacterium]HMO92262.1 phosphoenolpyruvate--protein phosphotransferase [Pirellulaceae bacterium]HMP70078.1 phosphoenolpyruvate--protein phosphotransferase [Pirellulaceae bacterium]
MRKGIAVSPGVAIGTAYVIHDIFVNPDTKRLEDSEVTAELASYETARDKAAIELRALERKVEAQVGHDEAAIFAVHQSILRDSAFTNKIRAWIVDDRLTAAAALNRLLEEYRLMFSRTDDQYLRDRVVDVQDVIARISSRLVDIVPSDHSSLEGPLIVIADELLPSQAVALGEISVAGIVTQAGSQTSHAAIIARSRGIPAVSGVKGILRQVKTGDLIVVDGRAGHVEVNPNSENLAAFRKLEREFFDLKDQLAENQHLPAQTADGTELKLQANINVVADAKSATAMGASAVGLYRTEYLYLTHPDVPDEDEQYHNYKEIIANSPNHNVTIRTLDIGGDKTVPYLGHHHQEANPFMGWRSIRLSFQHPELFNTQIRAILRAASEFETGTVRLMFPMVTNVEELRRLRGMVKRAQRALISRGIRTVPVPVGIMVEVPAAAICIEHILKLVDFVSIGSNDLVQYLMAADRDNPKVNHLCQPLAPAVLSVLKMVIDACNRSGKPVTVCGEMAGQPKTFIILLGMGLRRFSMSPAFIPSAKQLASQITVAEAENIVRSVLTFTTTSQVRKYMVLQLKRLAPSLTLLDTA